MLNAFSSTIFVQKVLLSMIYFGSCWLSIICLLSSGWESAGRDTREWNDPGLWRFWNTQPSCLAVSFADEQEQEDKNILDLHSRVCACMRCKFFGGLPGFVRGKDLQHTVGAKCQSVLHRCRPYGWHALNPNV